jgi:hypothetical protein
MYLLDMTSVSARTFGCIRSVPSFGRRFGSSAATYGSWSLSRYRDRDDTRRRRTAVRKITDIIT